MSSSALKENDDDFDFDSLDDTAATTRSPLDRLFDHATSAVRSRTSEMGKHDLLYLYGRFKYANEGACNAPKPGMFNFEAKSKWESWKALGSTVSREQCKQEYIDRLDQCLPNWRVGFSLESSGSGDKGTFGIRMSTMSVEKRDEQARTCFDFCKEGNLVKLRECVIQVNDTDGDGMTMLMWACDRGHLDVVKYLVEHGADVNKRDSDGQTCLHYAVSCEHVEVVKYLASLSAIDSKIADAEGLTPRDLTQNKEIIDALG